MQTVDFRTSRPADLGEGGWGYSLIWPIWRRAAGQGMVFAQSEHSALNRVYNFMQVCSKQGLNLS